MTKKKEDQYGLVPMGSRSIIPAAQTNGDLTKVQKFIVEQTATHELKIQGSTRKAAFAAQCLRYVHDETNSQHFRAVQHAEALNEAARGTAYQQQVEKFNFVNHELLVDNLYAIEDAHGEALYREVQRPFNEEIKKRGWFNRG